MKELYFKIVEIILSFVEVFEMYPIDISLKASDMYDLVESFKESFSKEEMEYIQSVGLNGIHDIMMNMEELSYSVEYGVFVINK